MSLPPPTPQESWITWKFNFGTEGGIKEGSVPKNICSVRGCTWLMTSLKRTTGHLGRQGEDQGVEDKLQLFRKLGLPMERKRRSPLMTKQNWKPSHWLESNSMPVTCGRVGWDFKMNQNEPWNYHESIMHFFEKVLKPQRLFWCNPGLWALKEEEEDTV